MYRNLIVAKDILIKWQMKRYAPAKKLNVNGMVIVMPVGNIIRKTTVHPLRVNVSKQKSKREAKKSFCRERNGENIVTTEQTIPAHGRHADNLPESCGHRPEYLSRRLHDIQ